MSLTDFVETHCAVKCELGDLTEFETYRSLADLADLQTQHRSRRDIMDGIIKAYKSTFKAM